MNLQRVESESKTKMKCLIFILSFASVSLAASTPPLEEGVIQGEAGGRLLGLGIRMAMALPNRQLSIQDFRLYSHRIAFLVVNSGPLFLRILPLQNFMRATSQLGTSRFNESRIDSKSQFLSFLDESRIDDSHKWANSISKRIDS